MKRGLVLSGLLGGCLLSAPASAQLAIDHLWVDFDSGSTNRADVVIRNESKDRYYIAVNASEVLAAGTDKEARVEEADPEKLGVLVTPNRLIIDPGGTRAIRMVSLNGDLAAERVYRVKVTPQVGDIIAPDAGAGNHGINIKVLAAYDLLVTVRPRHAKANIGALRSPDQLLLTNSGNADVLLYDMIECGAGEKDHGKCAKIGSKRLYPGNDWKIPLKVATDQVIGQEKVSTYLDPKPVTF